MTVFKCQMKVAQRNIYTIIIYFAIFIGMSIAIQKSEVANDNNTDVFSNYSVKIGVVDRDKSDVSKGIIKFLSEIHEVKVLEDDIGVLKESLYYFENDIILQFPKGFEENLYNADIKIDVTEQVQNDSYMYIQSQVNDVVNCVRSYMAAGYLADESFEKIMLQEDSKVSIIDVNDNGGVPPTFSYMFRFFPYICIAILGNAIGLMMTCIRQKNIRKRMEASAISLNRQNFENILAFILVGTIIWGAFLGVTAIIEGREFLDNGNFVYYIVNSFVMTLVGLSISFIIGMVAGGKQKISMIVTSISLFVSFIGGVFVPLSVLNDTIRKIAKFVPVYWYEEINNSLVNYASLPNDIVHEVWRGIGIQCLFAAALTGIALVISKYKKQEK